MNIPSMQPQCTPAEWQARVDLAACCRLVDLYGMSDMMANPISSHVPDEASAFLINAYGLMHEEISASSLIKVDLVGNILAKPAFFDESGAPGLRAARRPRSGAWRLLRAPRARGPAQWRAVAAGA